MPGLNSEGRHLKDGWQTKFRSVFPLTVKWLTSSWRSLPEEAEVGRLKKRVSKSQYIKEITDCSCPLGHCRCINPQFLTYTHQKKSLWFTPLFLCSQEELNRLSCWAAVLLLGKYDSGYFSLALKGLLAYGKLPSMATSDSFSHRVGSVLPLHTTWGWVSWIHIPALWWFWNLLWNVLKPQGVLPSITDSFRCLYVDYGLSEPPS